MTTWVYGEYLVYARGKNSAIKKFKERFGLVLSKWEITRGSDL